MAAPRHLGNDRWIIRIADGTKPNGQPWQASRVVRAPNKSAAARAGEKIVPELRKQLAARKAKHRAENDPTVLTVARLTAMWLDAKRREGRAAATIEQYEASAQRWIPALGSIVATELTPTQVDGWLAGMTVQRRDGSKLVVRPAAASTKRQAVKDLGSCLKFGASKFPGHLPTPPVTAAVTLPAHQTRRRSVPDLDRLREAVPAMLEQGAFGIAGAIALGAGLRQGEVCALRWSSISGKRLHVANAVKRHGPLMAAPKRDSVRSIPISSVTNEALVAAADWVDGTALEGSQWVLPSARSDGPLRPGSVSHGWPAVAERVGLAGVTFHDLRHACGSLLLEEGVPIVQVSAALGHANVAITMRVYAHIIGQLGDSLFDGLDRALGY